MTTTTERAPVEVVAAVEAKVAEYSQPDRTHRYLRGGIHADVSGCGACGRLHAYRHVLALLRERGL